MTRILVAVFLLAMVSAGCAGWLAKVDAPEVPLADFDTAIETELEADADDGGQSAVQSVQFNSANVAVGIALIVMCITSCFALGAMVRLAKAFRSWI